MGKLKRLTKSAFLDSASEFMTIARQALQSDGYLDMIVAWVTPEGKIFATDQYSQPLGAIETLRRQGRHQEAGNAKAEIWSAIREHLQKEKAVGYFALSDAFVSMKQLQKGEIAYGEEPGQIMLPEVTLPRLDPKRREAIVINWEWKGPPENIHSSGNIRQFYRREGNRIILEEIERQGDPIGGSQAGLLL